MELSDYSLHYTLNPDLGAALLWKMGVAHWYTFLFKGISVAFHFLSLKRFLTYKITRSQKEFVYRNKFSVGAVYVYRNLKKNKRGKNKTIERKKKVNIFQVAPSPSKYFYFTIFSQPKPAGGGAVLRENA